MHTLDGRWRIVSFESEGRPHPASEFERFVITIYDGHATLSDGTTTAHVDFSLDPSTTPHRIDSTYLDGPNAGFMSPGIYEETQGHFRMCRPSRPGVPRPSAFATSPGSGLGLVAWERIEAPASDD